MTEFANWYAVGRLAHIRKVSSLSAVNVSPLMSAYKTGGM